MQPSLEYTLRCTRQGSLTPVVMESVDAIEGLIILLLQLHY